MQRWVRIPRPMVFRASMTGARTGCLALYRSFLPESPRDPAGAANNNGPQYFYISDGSGYKLIAHGVSADGSSVEVLGIKIDPARRNENGYWAYGFWTEGLEKF